MVLAHLLEGCLQGVQHPGCVTATQGGPGPGNGVLNGCQCLWGQLGVCCCSGLISTWLGCWCRRRLGSGLWAGGWCLGEGACETAANSTQQQVGRAASIVAPRGWFAATPRRRKSLYCKKPPLQEQGGRHAQLQMLVAMAGSFQTWRRAPAQPLGNDSLPCYVAVMTRAHLQPAGPGWRRTGSEPFLSSTTLQVNSTSR